MTDERTIKQWVEEKIAGTGCFIVDIKISSKRIQVFLDKPEGITIAECSLVSRHLYSMLEGDPVLETHELEVSSPGIDQPLKVYPQYVKKTGREVKILLSDGKEKKGIMKEVTPEGITLEEIFISKEKGKKIKETTSTFIPFAEIKETKLIISFK
jgi:ribosome maturation factor RimP